MYLKRHAIIIRCDESLIQAIDLIWPSAGYKSRTEFIRNLLENTVNNTTELKDFDYAMIEKRLIEKCEKLINNELNIIKNHMEKIHEN